MFSPPLAEIREKRCGCSVRRLPNQGFALERFKQSHVLTSARALSEVSSQVTWLL